MLRWFFAGTATLALVGTGLVHGYWTDRWQPSALATEAAARLEGVPLDLGDWQGEPLRTGSAGAGVAGFMQRNYVNRRTGARVVMALVCGRPGPVSIHTPDACYVASGFTVAKPQKSRVGIGGAAGELWVADATQTKVTEETRLRIFWGWQSGGRWRAADNPRQEFARQPVLHKLYVLRQLDGAQEAGRGEPCQEFMEVLLPALDRSLFPPVAASN